MAECCFGGLSITHINWNMSVYHSNDIIGLYLF